MEKNEELQGCVFAVPSKTPFITSKPLVHKKKHHSEEYLQMKRFFRENDFSVYTDPETGEIICKVIPKDMDVERKKAEREKKIAAIADLMDSKNLTVEDLENLIAKDSDIETNMPKPEVEQEEPLIPEA